MSIKKSLNAYTKTPFLFVWSTIMYMLMLFVVTFACIGIFLGYFLALSIFNVPLEVGSSTTLFVGGLVILLFVFLSGGLNAALARSYHAAFWREKTSLTTFYAHALDKSPEVFGIQLLRDLVWLILAGPAIAAYVLFLKAYLYMDFAVGLYLVFVTFVIHMAFTPAFLCAGAFGTALFRSLKHTFEFLKRRHVFFVGIYILFAIIWLFNFIPLLDIVTIFVVYPIAYTALSVMIEDSIKLERVDD